MKKLMTMLLIVVMVLASAVTVFGQDEPTGQGGDRTITVANPSAEETYTLYKLFDATVTADGTGVNYTGEVPDALKDYFEADDQGNITAKFDTMTEDIATKIADYAKTTDSIAEVVSDGSTLQFTGLKAGYYVVTSTLGTKATINTAKATEADGKNTIIYDKNTKEIDVVKTVGKESYSIGDTVTYTATFKTVNYLGEQENAKKVVEYEISDTLPKFLDNVNVSSITIDGEDYKVNGEFPQFDAEKKIVIPWAEKNDADEWQSLYKNGAEIVVTYTATLTDVVNVNGDNKNTITLKPSVDDGNGGKEPWEDSWSDDEIIKTYAAAINKVDQDGEPLAGATFTIKGLTVAETAPGVYTVVSYNPAADAADSEPLATDENGKLYIVGLEEALKLVVTEAQAPEGYNLLEGNRELSPQVLDERVYKLSGYEKYDADGNLVEFKEEQTETYTQVTENLGDLDAEALVIENNKGTVMPSTGGIGTTILYTLGGLLVVGAGVLLVARRKMDN